jgi:hypothetical protein
MSEPRRQAIPMDVSRPRRELFLHNGIRHVTPLRPAVRTHMIEANAWTDPAHDGHVRCRLGDAGIGGEPSRAIVPRRHPEPLPARPRECFVAQEAAGQRDMSTESSVASSIAAPWLRLRQSVNCLGVSPATRENIRRR